MKDEDGYDAQDKDGDDGLPWARDRETQGFRETEIHAQATCVRRRTFMPSVRGE